MNKTLTTRLSQRGSMREEVRLVFHEFFNVLAVLQAFSASLQTETRSHGADPEVAKSLDLIVTALRERAESVRIRVVNLVG